MPTGYKKGCVMRVKTNKGEKEDFGIKDTIKEIIEKAKRSIVKKDSHYRLPLTLINDYTWANLSQPAQALLVVIGCFQNQFTGACFLARETMAKHTGYSNLAQTIDPALRELVFKYLITKRIAKPSNEYFLTDKAKCEKKKTYFRLFQYQVEKGYWAKLKPCEKALYPVLYVKGSINNSEIKDDIEVCCKGEIKSIKKLTDLAGIHRSSFKRTISGFYAKSLIDGEIEDNVETYYLYRLDRLYDAK
ncbi:hypothetical protein ES705_20250 [subsurface metagenome]